MEEKTENATTKQEPYEYRDGQYTVSISFSGKDALEDCLSRYVKKRLEKQVKKF